MTALALFVAVFAATFVVGLLHKGMEESTFDDYRFYLGMAWILGMFFLLMYLGYFIASNI
jgi:hypothetical protein